MLKDFQAKYPTVNVMEFTTTKTEMIKEINAKACSILLRHRT